jgi:hypothetical protein
MKLKVKTVQLGDLQLPIAITNTAMAEYEEMTGEAWPSFKNTRLRIQFFYCIAKEGARIESKEFTYSFDAFWQLVDGYYFEILNNVMPVIFELMPKGKDSAEKKR